jgi:hypothetical protein
MSNLPSTALRQAGWIIDIVAKSGYGYGVFSTWLAVPHELRAHVGGVTFRVPISKWLANHFVSLWAMRDSPREFLPCVSNSMFPLARESTKLYFFYSVFLFSTIGPISVVVLWNDANEWSARRSPEFESRLRDRLCWPTPFRLIFLPLPSTFVYVLLPPPHVFFLPRLSHHS